MGHSFTCIAIVAWAAVASTAVAAVPMPDGEYAVGVVRAEFVDSSRRLDAADPASGPRRMPAIVWYPAAGRAAAGDVPYMQGDVAAVTVPAIARNFGYAVEELHAMTVLRMDVRSGAPPARHPRGFPVVVFSHGFFLYPEQNSALASRLASHGYIVVSIAHPHDAADLRLEDAAVNLDGQNFDPDLFDRPVERPLLLMLSDWTRYSVFEGQPRDADFSPNDLAYEPWHAAGEGRDVLRVRLEGIRHMGFTDLVALLDGPKREERVGEIGGDAALAAIGDLVLAFLDVHVRDVDAAAIDRAIERHPALRRHSPVRVKGWVGGSE